MNSIICPVGPETINLNVSRTTVFLNVLLMGLFFLTNNPIFIVITALDYFIRAFIDGKYSPLKNLASVLVKTLKLDDKKINLAQKVFASRLGTLCAVAALIFFQLDMSVGTVISLGMLFILSIADSVFNFCVGCLIYNYLVLPFSKKD